MGALAPTRSLVEELTWSAVVVAAAAAAGEVLVLVGGLHGQSIETLPAFVVLTKAVGLAEVLAPLGVEDNLDTRTCQGAFPDACQDARTGRHMADIAPLESHMASLPPQAVLLPWSCGSLVRVHLAERAVVVHVPGIHQNILLDPFQAVHG